MRTIDRRNYNRSYDQHGKESYGIYSWTWQAGGGFSCE